LPLQTRLPLLPPEAQIISRELALANESGRVVLFNAAGPIFSFDEDDAESRRLAVAIVSQLNLATPKALAESLGIHRSMVSVYRKQYAESGASALRTQKSGPKAAHKLRGPKLSRAQELLDEGASNRAVARELGMSEGAVRLAMKQGRLRRGEPRQRSERLAAPRQRNGEDRTASGGVAVKRHADRAAACMGVLAEAAPSFQPAENVERAGVLLALPAVVAEGVYDVATQVYARLRNGYYGLNAVVSTLVFMSLLRIKNPEQLASHAPGEFGRILGLDRAPETKTLRRKLAEMGRRGKALEFMGELAERWATEKPDLLGYLYVDGHVRPYNGRRHELPKTHVPRRRLCMPATTDYWVNDASADPLFFVTAPGNEGMLEMLEEILPEVRRLAGERRVTLVMDRLAMEHRQSWSPKRFKAWSREGFDVMTYRKGRYEDWPKEVFSEHVSRQAGRKKDLLYKLAERPLVLSGGFEVREVRRLTETGHQTSIVTTRRDLSILEVAERMFSRWRQENFFRYMRHEFDLDHLSTYAVEAADLERPVPNPERKRKKKKLAELRGELGRLKRLYGEMMHEDAFETAIERVEIRTQIEDLKHRAEELRREHNALPSHVPVGVARDPHTVVQLERERKILMDEMKMVAYRAETELARLVGPLLGSHDDEARSFLRRVFQLPADVVPDEEAGTLVVRLHGMANWRSNQALHGLCAILNAYDTRYPGTDLRLVLEPPSVGNENAQCPVP
jgi:transposase